MIKLTIENNKIKYQELPYQECVSILEINGKELKINDTELDAVLYSLIKNGKDSKSLKGKIIKGSLIINGDEVVGVKNDFTTKAIDKINTKEIIACLKNPFKFSIEFQKYGMGKALDEKYSNKEENIFELEDYDKAKNLIAEGLLGFLSQYVKKGEVAQ